jgi:hypothetical protein
MLKRVLAALLTSTLSTVSAADVLVFDCRFPDAFSFYLTVYDDGSPARIGVEQGVGDKAETYFDKVTGAWIAVEFIDDGKLPATLTTVLSDGTVLHSRHSLSADGQLLASQQQGICRRKTIR